MKRLILTILNSKSNTDSPATAQGTDEGVDAYPRTVRLQRYLARSGVASRRGSEDLMTAGRVTVNGEVVCELGSKVNPETDVVAVDGVVVQWDAESIVLALHKPVGYVCTMLDPGGKPCVADLVPTNEYPGLYPIGRLDRNTSGLILFTTDGNLGHSLLHPSHHVEKVYEAVVQGKVLPSQVERLRAGVEIDDPKVGAYLTAPAEVEILGTQKRTTTLRITIHEGRYHQVRKMCDAIGHTVVHLHRTQVGPIEIGALQEGSWRIVDEDERARLYRAAGLAC